MIEIDSTPAAYAALMDGRRKAVAYERKFGQVPIPGDHVCIRHIGEDGNVVERAFVRVTWVDAIGLLTILSVEVRMSTARMLPVTDGA